MLQSMGSQRVAHDLATEQPQQLLKALRTQHALNKFQGFP